jgi:septum formation protein
MKRARIILASRSTARVKMLRAAGVKFTAIPADINEERVIKKLQKQKRSPRIISKTLAQQKALAISKKNPGALVIGSDQVLTCEGRFLTKAGNAKDAANKIKSLCGKTHILTSAVCVARDGKILWSHISNAHMKARNFDDGLLKAYLAKAGPALTRSVGGMEIEGMGSWLIHYARGDFFTILGMPLLPLLGYLHDEHGILP